MNCLFFVVMAIISVIFDTISCILHLMHSQYGIYDKKAPTIVLVAQTVFIFTPVMLLVSAGVAWSIYSDCRNNGTYESDPWGEDPYARPAYTEPRPVSRPPARNDNPPRSGNSSQSRLSRVRASALEAATD